MFELKDVYKYYHNQGVTNKGLLDVNLKLERGEIVVITGESGSGKSTLLNVITKQDTFDEGEIYYYGNETSYFSVDDMDHFRKNKIGFIFQNYNIIDSYTVLENVMLPLIINDVPYKEAKAEAMEIIKKVGLEKWAKNRGTKLSGGQKQRCVIARALASRCDVLACDEPTGNLDVQTGNEIVELIKEVAQDKLVLIVTHNYDQFAKIATRKIKVHDGQIIEDTYINRPENEENKELDLDYVPVKYKTDARIALNNLKSTPRKTFLMCLITLFTAFFAFYLYQASYTLIRNSYKSNPFVYQGDNKVIAYDKNHNTIDTSKFDGKYDYQVNVFTYDDDFINVKYNYYNSYLQFGYEPFVPTNTKIKVGEMPKNDGELLVVVPSTQKLSNESYYEGFVEANANEFILNDNIFEVPYEEIKYHTSLDSRKVYKIKGIAVSKDITKPILVPATNKDRFYFRMYSYKSSYYYNIVIDNTMTTQLVKRRATNEIILPNYLSDKSILKKEIPTVIDENTDKNYFIIGYDFAEYENIYEVSLYGDKSSIKSTLSDLNLRYIDVKTFDTSTAMERFLANLFSYISIASQTITILIIYIIASLILLKVFSSKMDSYAIFRTLGVTKKDMKKILNLEVFVTVMFTTFLNLGISIVFYILKIDNAFFEVYHVLAWNIILIYILVMVGISMLLSRKFNKKLFKSSISKTLREEE